MTARLPSVAALAAASIVWGLTFVFAKSALDDFSALEAAFLRLLFAVPLLVPLAWAHGGLRAPLRLTAPLAATGMVGYFVFTHLGLERASVSAGAFIQALAPVLTVVLAVALLRERPTRGLAAGIALAVVGACLLAWDAVRLEAPLGLAFFFLGTLAWALNTVLVHRFADRLSALAATTLPTILGTAVLAPLALAGWQSSAGLRAWLLVAALGVAGGGVGFVLWNYGVARVPASYAGVFTNLPPVVAVFAATLFLNDDVTAREGLGGAIVIAGALVASARPPVRGRRHHADGAAAGPQVATPR